MTPTSTEAQASNANKMQFSALAYMVIDAFTDRPFAGNPAAVLQLPCWPGGGATIGTGDTHWLQRVATEFNLSETAFLVRRVEGGGDEPSATTQTADEFDLRWFTPAVEVDLCGHATLASAHFLWATNAARASLIKFHTASGILSARRIGAASSQSGKEQEVGAIELDFPAVPPEACEELRGEVADALGVSEISAVLKSRLDLLVELPSVDAVKQVTPNFRKLAAFDVRGFIITAAGGTSSINGESVDFISRFFAPACGIDEDPVTGSAHCTLGPYWSEKLGKNDLSAFQASKRGGQLNVIVDSKAGRVRLQGTCFATASGVLRNAHLALDPKG